MVGVITFSNSAMFILPLTQNKDAIKAAVNATAGNALFQTNIGAGLTSSAELFNGVADSGSRAIILVSDGAGRIDANTQQKIRDWFDRFQIGLYWIVLRQPDGISIFDENYVSITKYDVADWNEITMEVRAFIRTYLAEGKPVLLEHFEEEVQDDKLDAPPPVVLDDISEAIVNILDEYIKPAVAGDGGNIQFSSYNSETKEVQVILQGACSGCPSSTLTLKNGIESLLHEMLDGKVSRVIAING